MENVTKLTKSHGKYLVQENYCQLHVWGYVTCLVAAHLHVLFTVKSDVDNHNLGSSDVVKKSRGIFAMFGEWSPCSAYCTSTMYNNAFTSFCFAFKMATVNVQLAWMILRISNSRRYGTMLYHGTIVCLFHRFQHAWFHRARQPCSVQVGVHTERFNCIFV